MSTNKDKVVLITGATSGIGEATAYLFSRKGYKIAAHGRKIDLLQKVIDKCNEISPNNNKALAVIADFDEGETSKCIVEKTVDHFGRLDTLINNAGMYKLTPVIGENGYKNYNDVLQVNINSSVSVTLEAVPHLLKSNEASIVFVSSANSKKPEPSAFAYCMSKAAMDMFSQCVAQELAPKVRVNVVRPGVTKTDIYAKIGFDKSELEDMYNSTCLMRRMATSEEIAQSIYFLASNKSAFTTGADLIVDGGYVINTPADA